MKKNLFLDKIYRRADKIEDKRKSKVIKSIMKKENWYAILDVDMVISILMDLGFNKEESMEVYKCLLICK